MYHGQRITQGSGAGHWRVDNELQDLNMRTRFACRGNDMWYLGRRPPGSIGDDSAMRANLYEWTVNLFNDGYVSTPGISIIFPDAELLPNGQIDPANLGGYIRAGDPHYLLNWIVLDDGTLEGVPNAP